MGNNHLSDHWVRVDLAHVLTRVLLLHILDRQRPGKKTATCLTRVGPVTNAINVLQVLQVCKYRPIS